MKKRLTILLLALYAAGASARPAEELKTYMRTQSLTWEQLPTQWNEGAFLGNGRIGMMVYIDPRDNSLTLWLGRPDVTDHRMAPDRKSSIGVKGASVMTDFCRMDVGRMKLFPEGRILDGNFELDIYDARLTGLLHTDRGDIRIRAFTPYDREVNVVETETDVRCSWRLQPGSPRSPRIQVFPHLKERLHYDDNPAPQLVTRETEGWSVHPLTAGGDYATYWRCETSGSGRTSVLYVSTKNEVPQSGRSLAEARKEVERAVTTGPSALERRSTAWWNAYYTTGMIDIPDRQLENFYHIQLYKLAACSHPDGPVMDCLGTFYKTTQWPGIWWNLNVQLTYLSTLATNRLEQGANYVKLLDERFEKILAAHDPARCGDFVWALHTYYAFLRYSGAEWPRIAQGFVPKAEALLRIYEPHLEERNGVFHLLDTESPEYDGFKTYTNSNYNLAALRWLLTTLIELSDRSGVRPAAYARWVDLRARLHPAPVDANGYRIASDQAVDKSHRHFSHLLAFYPLHLCDPDDPQTRAVLERSLDHWLGIDGGRELAGYSYTGGASLWALLGNGERAHALLKHFLNEPIGMGLLLPNTFYVESGGRNPVIETPLSAATAVTEMLLQNRNGILRIFPAVPESWRECSFRELRAEGGFVVSASRESGKLRWVRIRNESGERCRILLPEWDTVCRTDGPGCRIVPEGDGCYAVSIPKGGTVVLAEKRGTKARTVRTLPPPGARNFYGVKKGQGLPRRMEWPENGE